MLTSSFPNTFCLIFPFLFCNTDEPKYWYWEVIVIFKKMLLTGAMTIIAAGSSAQLVIALLIVLIDLLLVLKLGPFTDDSDDILSFLTSCQMFLTLLGGLLIMMDNPIKPTYDPTFMGITMVIVNSFGFFALIMSLVLLTPKCRNKMNGQKKIDVTKVAPIDQNELTMKEEENITVQNWGTP